MIRKSSFWVTFVIVFTLTAGMLYLISLNVSKPSEVVEVAASHMLPGEKFILRHMINDDGTLKTNLQPHLSTDPDIARGDEALSESIGLWMLYLAEKRDNTLFEKMVRVLKKQFMKNDGWIYWKLGPRPATANALIDDLRIAEALYKADAIWPSAEFGDMANTISHSLIKKQFIDGLFTDFYDIHSKRSSEHLTLSYLSAFALSHIYEHGRLDKSEHDGMIHFLQNLPTQNGFFPFSYHLKDKTYKYHEQVHLIDQLYIVYHRAQAGTASPETWSFLKEEFAQKGLIYGRYAADSKQPAVDYESPAVYGLAILAAIELNDGEFAKDLYYRMIHHQTLNPESEWYGGFIDTNDTHIFDNLLPLLAERKMYDARLLR